VIDDFAGRILGELIGVEKERPLPSVSKSEQQNGAAHWTRPILMERAAYLGKMAKYGDGSASETIREQPQHRVMLSFRSRTGEAEVHAQFADVFYVVEGTATLVTGGTVEGAKEISPGEIRGASVTGGVRCQLRPGDVVHVPAGVPHQFLVEGERTVCCLVLKVRENP
jgi:mannose-6-phosphate isomerase-like protein (cupin superfamily)